MYKFAVSKENYEDYSSGRVLYGSPGATNFPVRLLEEIFLRLVNNLKERSNIGPYNIYDPFCGIAYSLTVTGLRHGDKIKYILASDTDKTILDKASKNLSLLDKKYFNNRIAEIQLMIEKFNKESHNEALISAEKILPKNVTKKEIQVNLFPLNIIGSDEFPQHIPKIDIVLCDLPYGKLTSWNSEGKEGNNSQLFLDKIKKILNEKSIIGITANKKQPIGHVGYKKVEGFKIGKRKVLILEPIF